MWQMQIWLAGMWYYHRFVSKQREGILVCVGVCFCPAHMKTFFPCQDCSRRLWNHIVTPLLTPRKHTTGKANTHTWSNSPTPPEDKGEWPCVCVRRTVYDVCVCLWVCALTRLSAGEREFSRVQNWEVSAGQSVSSQPQCSYKPSLAWQTPMNTLLWFTFTAEERTKMCALTACLIWGEKLHMIQVQCAATHHRAWWQF